jgi:Zn-dependent peptidase ImmA (M78 family)
VTESLLPDWWDDALSTIPANRALAEATISRMLGLPMSQLSDPSQSLTCPPLSQVKLKHDKRSKPSEIAPSILLAEQAASTLSRSTTIGPFSGLASANVVRDKILAQCPRVDLEALLQFAWLSGVVVFHLGRLPKNAKRFAGIAMFSGNTPVVILASARDAKPWITFHLAHELGHIFLGHVVPGSGSLADVDLDSVDDDTQETEADRFACEVLTSLSSPYATAQYGLTGEKLVPAATQQAQKFHADPGVVALIYGRAAKRMAVAQKALKLMGLESGARATLHSALLARLTDEPSDVTDQFVALTAPA